MARQVKEARGILAANKLKEFAEKYASSSNAALLDKVQKLRFSLYHYAPFDGKSHTTSCSIWREDGQGHAEGFDGSMGPCNCGALINYWRERAEQGESERTALEGQLREARKTVHMQDEAWTAEVDELRAALRNGEEMYIAMRDRCARVELELARPDGLTVDGLLATLHKLGYDENGTCNACGHDACDCAALGDPKL